MVRKKAVDAIIKARKRFASDGIRTFEAPAVNFEAKHYYELIDVNDSSTMEPPLTKHPTIGELKECITNPDNLVNDLIKDVPCTTEAVERLIPVVTESAKRVFGEENRNEHIYLKLRSRETVPKMESKKDFLGLLK